MPRSPIGILHTAAQNLHQAKDSPFFRYVAVGLSAYLLELVIIAVGTHQGMPSILAVALSFWIGLIYSFIMQKLFSFNDRRTHHKVVLRQVLLVSALVIFNFLFTILLTKLLQPILNPFITRTLAIGMTTLWNFYLYRKHIFSVPAVD